MTDTFRALCAELVETWDATADFDYNDFGNAACDVVHRARAALAEPQGEGPTEDELLKLYGVATPCHHVDEWQRELDFARAVLSRWGTPNLAETRSSSQPPSGEVAELVAWLEALIRMHETGGGGSRSITRLRRAADLLEQLSPPQPVSVIDRLPKPETKVLAHYFNDLGNGRTICAIWVPAKTRCDSTGDDDFTEYDEDEDKFYWPEGWYEAIENWDDFGWVKVNEGEVMYWQPLPQWPTLPLPSGEAK